MAVKPKRLQALEIALGELGVTEHPMGSNTGPRVREYQATTFLGGSGWPWCAAFVCWCWWRVGKPLPYKTASAYGLLTWARGAGWAIPARQLSPGDIVVFNVGSGHVGIFERWEGSTIHSCDGNHNDMVARAARPLSTVAGAIHVPEARAPVHVPKPYWVIATSSSGKRVLVFSKFATQKTILGLLPRLFAKYGKAGVTIKRGGERPPPKV